MVVEHVGVICLAVAVEIIALDQPDFLDGVGDGHHEVGFDLSGQVDMGIEPGIELLVEFVPDLLGELLDERNFDFSVAVDLLLPDFLEVGLDGELDALRDQVILHHVGDQQQVVGVLEFGGLGFHQDPQDFRQDVAEADGVREEGECNVYCLQGVERSDVSVGDGGHGADAEVHGVLVLTVPRQQQHHLGVSLRVVYPT